MTPLPLQYTTSFDVYILNNVVNSIDDCNGVCSICSFDLFEMRSWSPLMFGVWNSTLPYLQDQHHFHSIYISKKICIHVIFVSLLCVNPFLLSLIPLLSWCADFASVSVCVLYSVWHGSLIHSQTHVEFPRLSPPIPRVSYLFL